MDQSDFLVSGAQRAHVVADQALERLSRPQDGQDAEKVGRAFETVLATLLVREVRKTLPEGFFGGGSGADTYESWFDEHLGESLAKSGALDLVGMIKSSIEQMQAARDASEDA